MTDGAEEVREMLDIGLLRGAGPNVFVSCSAGDARHASHVVTMFRHGSAPVWRAPVHQEFSAGTAPIVVADEIWRQMWRTDSVLGAVESRILLDITVAGRAFLDLVREHPEASPNAPVVGRVIGSIVSGSAGAVGKTIGRREVASPLGSVLASGQLSAENALLQAAGRFKYDPNRTTVTGEDAWRLEEGDGAALALALPMEDMRYALAHDLRVGQPAPPIKPRESHPICQAGLCMCRNCPRCYYGGDSGFRRHLTLCGWCQGRGSADRGEVAPAGRWRLGPRSWGRVDVSDQQWRM